MLNKIKELGPMAGLVIILVALCLIVSFGIEFIVYIAPYIRLISFVIIIICSTTLLLSFSRKTRKFTGYGLYTASFGLGAIVWIDCFVYTYNLWGKLAVAIGVFTMGIGVLPMAVLATLFKGMWQASLLFIFLMTVTWGIRIWGMAWIEEYSVD